MAKEDLDSDRINYMVWRYLQESDFRETASKLQREWNVANPQDFEFAPHVKKHALVSVLHRGLLYGDAERRSLQARGGVAAAPHGIFGPLAPLSPAPGAMAVELENGRKREMDPRQSQIRNGSPAKRPRLSNGHENGFDMAAMDVDEANGHAYPSPREVERLPTPTPTPIILTDGPERSTQVDKVAELGPETTYLTISDPERPSVKPMVLFCAWNPRNPTVLAGAGTDRLARLWTISRGTAADSHSHVNGATTPYQDLAEPSASGREEVNQTITSLAWTSDGAAVAVAEDGPYERDSAMLTIWGEDGSLLQEYPGFQPPILSLQWNPSNRALLALLPEYKSSLVTVFSPSSPRNATFDLSTLHGAVQPVDAVWISDQEFIVCGGDLLATFQWSGADITPMRAFETRQSHGLNRVIYDRHSRLVATSSDTGIIDIWHQSGQCHSLNAHDGQITSLFWQPLPNNPEMDNNSERLLVSSGEDGAIRIWSTSGDGRPKYTIPLNAPVVALAFTPDGAFLASATTHQVLIWKIEDLSFPRARWAPDPQSLRGSNGMCEGSVMDVYCLSWDANGQKLAYAVNHNLAVIEWKPLATGGGL